MLVALGGNAMTGPDGNAAPHEQRHAIMRAMSHVADLVAAGHEVAITHGNGPQVGNILVKNELAAHVVPARPARLVRRPDAGHDRLHHARRARGRPRAARRGRPVAALVTRTLVDADDPGFTHPTKPIGRFLPRERGARPHRPRRGLGGPRREGLAPRRRLARAARGARRHTGADRSSRPATSSWPPAVAASPSCAKPRHRARRRGRHRQGPHRRPAGARHRRRRPRDRHRRRQRRRRLGHPRGPTLGRVTLGSCEAYAADGEFASGSMGPKVDAAMRSSGRRRRSIITALDQITHAVDGGIGTVIENPRPSDTKGESPCPKPSRSARSRSTPCPTPPSSASSSTTASWRRPRHRHHRQDRGQRRGQRLHPDHRRPRVPRGARRQGCPRGAGRRCRSCGLAAPTA